ncbi:hypothetical protein KC963_05525, partial [Candidatus Saccharibacteria bacterium]|nr:hypothetical protein [Candidatus Saccharibacteria bacterium]
MNDDWFIRTRWLALLAKLQSDIHQTAVGLGKKGLNKIASSAGVAAYKLSIPGLEERWVALASVLPVQVGADGSLLTQMYGNQLYFVDRDNHLWKEPVSTFYYRMATEKI